MSHRGNSDVEFPPSLAVLPSPSAEQGKTRAYNRFSLIPVNGFPAHDRHGTASTYGPQRTLTFSPPQPVSPRSFGMQEHEYGIPHIDANTWPSPLDNARSGLLPQPTYKDRDSHTPRVAQTTPNPSSQPQFVYTSSATSAVTPPPSTSSLTRSTLWWGELEPWMDEEYAKQVCNLMRWEPLSIKVPHPPPDSLTGQQANNPGYCFLTFPTPAHAASVLAQINNNGSGTPITMPNSNKPFLLNWASSTPIPPSFSPPGFPTQSQQHAKEYSIFVGDLAPEASNSDLVAVFRNPVLGLRSDRQPKIINPFLSCKSAKIMLDPVTGVSRGYGFVRCVPTPVVVPNFPLSQDPRRFTDEADQQRALIEMHGLYCLSRPNRNTLLFAQIYKAPPAEDLPQVQIPQPGVAPHGAATIALPLPSPVPTKSSSAGTTSSSNSLSSSGVSSSGSSSSLAQYAHSASSKPVSDAPASITAPFARQDAGTEQARYSLVEESWKHQAQARAILSNLIGPNGEQLTSTDPYNTTVFVGGLSPLISEETLKTFFAPFGDIHYVKVPVGKHCGFVQFVRKADAERAIEKMQGFPIGGSRIRLSWGRSQYKAAQAAAQAAHAAALQAHLQSQMVSPRGTPITMEQTSQQNQAQTQSMASQNDGSPQSVVFSTRDINSTSPFGVQPAGGFGGDIHTPRAGISTSFSPFSPDPNLFHGGDLPSGAAPKKPEPLLYHPSSTTGFAQGFGSGPALPHDASNTMGANGKVTTPHYPIYHEMTTTTTISRPPSGLLGASHERQECFEMPEHEHDLIMDLNGTLASLDLDSVNHLQSPSPPSTSLPASWMTPSSSSPTA
ncbi:hypothetical protein BGY98DRAFT_955600 [Russula aff. rugulosa BPL654]|nr:hypothetical protein BGY98DRAFT_955600 [Russula aff. rugulosa BPL654]